MATTQPIVEKKVTIQDMMRYIDRNVDDLSVAERVNIYKMIADSNIDHNKIQSKGGGLQIPYRFIPKHIISAIYSYIQNKIADKMTEFAYFPDNVDGSSAAVEQPASAEE